MTTEELRADLVFEGGGVKGIALAGAFLELDRRGYRPQCVAGTSAGAITAALVAAGYTGAELEHIVLEEMHFPLFADRQRLALLGPLGEGIEILSDRGLHSGRYFREWIGAKLSAKGIDTFGDLRDEQESNPRRRYRLQVIASDLTDHSMLVLPQDSARLGIEPDALPVADAVRMSMSIPIFFDPIIHPDGDRRKHLIVDGGLLSNYPIWLFDAPDGVTPRFPTLGMLLVAPHQQDPLLPGAAGRAAPAPAPSLIGYVKAIAETMMQAHDRLYVEQGSYARTIPIPTLGVRTTEFDIAAPRARELFQSGVDAASKFLSSWDFGAYLAKYRSGPRRSRRDDMLA